MLDRMEPHSHPVGKCKKKVIVFEVRTKKIKEAPAAVAKVAICYLDRGHARRTGREGTGTEVKKRGGWEGGGV